MTPPATSPIRWLLGAISLFVHPLVAQEAGLDFAYGAWWYGDARAISYTLSYHRILVGPLEYGLGLSYLNDGRAIEDRTQTGTVVSLAINRSGRGPYVFGGWGLGFRHADGNPDGFWTAGAGYTVRPVRVLSLGLEAAYRVEDRRVSGFWQLDPNDRRGLQLQGRLAIGLGGRPDPIPRPAPRPASGPRSSPGMSDRTAPDPEGSDGDGSGEADADLGFQVVSTALDAMGTPYRWGGGDENGYDCSGLIHYAYGEHGILLPRRSRDQARTGEQVDRDVNALHPGDILGFSIGGGGVSHVGLYVGDGVFIHSTSSGVTLSSLTASDPDSRWWQQRWITARRILN